MKRQLHLNLILLSCFCITTVFAQTDVDALRYSGTAITGTARFSAMSGAFGALGGDFSSISINPAGLGIYRTSEFTITPSIYVGATNSDFLNNSTSDNKYNFNLGNLGLVYTSKLKAENSTPGWKSWSFGFGYNRISNFHNRTYYEGKNRNNSLLDAFVQNANGLNYDQLDSYYEYLAYSAYLINPDASNQYTSVIPFAQEIQRRSSVTSGAIGETVFSFAGNYNNKLFLGGSLNFRSLRYTEETTYEELDPDTTIPNFKRFQFDQNLTTRGNGFNLKLGIIYKATDNVRLGFSMQTPTWYSLRDEYNNSMTANLDTGAIKSADSPVGAFDYNLTTPFRATASVGFIIGEMGLVSADYDFSDYSTSRFDAGRYRFTAANDAIRKKYTTVHTVRIGTEWRYENLSFRDGASLGTSPIQSAYKVTANDFSRKSFSGGIGVRDGGFFLDLGFVYTTSNEFFQPFTLTSSTVEGVRTKVNTNNFVMTLGWKF